MVRVKQLRATLYCQKSWAVARFVNADEITKGLSPFNPQNVAIEAGRIMLTRIRELMDDGVDFAFETTLSTRSYVGLIKEATQKGYIVSLLYFWLNSPQLAINRVAQRVANGGHSIEEPIIRRRYAKGVCNFFNLYISCVDYWALYDNSNCIYELVAEGGARQECSIHNHNLYNLIHG